MARKMYIPVIVTGRNQKLYVNDLVKIHSIAKRTRPPLPSYHSRDRLTKPDPMTDVEFEPLFLGVIDPPI
jgi:hypothetical protein